MLNGLIDLLRQFFEILIWWTVIQPWEQGLLVRLGRTPLLLLPGFHWKIPYMDQIYRQTVRRRYTNFGPQTVTTNDGQTLTLSGNVAYSIRDLRELYDRLHHPEDAIAAIAMGAISEFVAAQPASACTPQAICATCKESMGLRKFGLLVHAFDLTTFARVRTYRLIMDSTNSGIYGDALTTSRPDGPPLANQS